MATEGWYRYVGSSERSYIRRNLEVQSRYGTTWYALQRLTDWSDIQEDLALEDPPRECRVGPFFSDELPAFDKVPPRTVQPQKLRSGRWVSGGGSEAATSQPHYVYGAARVR